MLSLDVSSGPECCKPVTIFRSCENSGCADVLLTHQAANKEVQYDALVKSQQVRVDASMVREWDKWNEFRVTKVLSKKQLNDIMKRNPDQKIVGTRWVFTEKTIQGKPDYKARLVVQGCQEDKGHIRTDAPTGSRDAFFMTLSASAQSGWDYSVFDAQSAYLQSDGIKRLLLLRMPHNNPPLGTKPGQVFVATGSIYGTRDAGRAWYEHSKKVLEAAGFAESRLEQGLYYLHGPSGLEALVQCGLVCCLTHSPELLITGRLDLSTIISGQSSTIKRVVRSKLEAEDMLCLKGSNQLNGLGIC